MDKSNMPILKQVVHFILSRWISAMMQHLALQQPPLENYIGMICLQTSSLKIVQHAVDGASMMCCCKSWDAPKSIISGHLDLTFLCIPMHLHYMLLELLKNALRATVEHHVVDNNYPPVCVIIADGNKNEDVVIKVADEVGGIPQSHNWEIQRA
eukprot:13132359-Ditylum_brightwellii.AAC.2